MIEVIDTIPDTKVQPAEYKRLLGYPPDYVLDGRARELADWARGWYAANGQPWIYARQVESLQVNEDSVQLNETSFRSKPLGQMLTDARASSAVLVAVGAGAELEAEAQRLWSQERPDEYFFLEIFGSAVVEHLVTLIGARLCSRSEQQGVAVLPHYSPGYPDWSIDQQPALLDLLRRGGLFRSPPCQLEVMDSGMLRPKKSLLAVFGLTNQVQLVRRLTDLVPCENCALCSCQYRRAPYKRLLSPSRSVQAEATTEATYSRGIDCNAKYSINQRALDRWASERLKLTHHEDGTIDVLFRFDGSTCSNMGRALRFDYFVKLGPSREGYPIYEQRCSPAPGDEGYRYMCRYMANSEHLLVAIDREKPLLGRPLNEVLSWDRPESAPSCYCEPQSRKHKWGLVLETIHYALAQRQKAGTE